MLKENIFEWLNEMNFEYTPLQDVPPSYQSAVVVNKSKVIILLHKSEIAEMQCACMFDEEITDKFLGLGKASKNKIIQSLREKITMQDVRHQILEIPGKKIFGFILMTYMPENLSKTDLINNHKRIEEIRDFAYGHVISLMKEEEGITL